MAPIPWLYKGWIKRDDIYSKCFPGSRQVHVESVIINLEQVSQQWTPSEFHFQFFGI